MLDAHELLRFAAALAVGLLLGGCYFGSLWLSLRRMLHAPHPLRLYFGELVVRLTFVLAGVYAVLVFVGWIHVMITLLGFYMARLFLVRVIGRAMSDPIRQEAL